MGRLRLVVIVAVLALLSGACQVSVVAGVVVGRDGTGRVTAGIGLDADAVKELGDPATALRLDDVRQAGWQVEGPRKEGDGLTWIRASKPFDDVDQVPAIVAELNGSDGPFRDFRVVRAASLLRSRTTFSGTLDLSRGLVGFVDPELTAALGDVDPGLDLDGLRGRFGDDLATSVRVQARVELPGSPTTNAPATENGVAVWTPELGQTVELAAFSEAFRIDPALPIIAVGVLLTAGMLLVVAARRRRRG